MIKTRYVNSIEINYLKKKGRIPDTLCVLTVEDPAKNIGSGAATLNALLVATEHLSVKQNYMVSAAFHHSKLSVSV